MSELRQEAGRKKSLLGAVLSDPLQWLADNAASVWKQQERLDWVLQDAFHVLPYCHLLYALDRSGIQLSSNVSPDSRSDAERGQSLANRPYLEGSLPYQGFVLSKAYISHDRGDPCVTAVQAVRKGEELLGFIAADFDVAALPATSTPSRGPTAWQQFRGDPAIRDTLFMQHRIRSPMDERAEEVFAIVTALMRYHGVFHGKLHFSSSRLTIWHVDDPCNYRLHGGSDIDNPDLCLIYACRKYPQRAVIPPDRIRMILEQFRILREADDTIYLRAGSLNVINGMIGLTFSCDGAHYMHVEEFLDRGIAFWLSSATCSAETG